jgi:hypothetical protein
MLSTASTVRFIDQTGVNLKLAQAAPTILAENRIMVTTMLEAVKSEIMPATPLGPGHFGYHLIDTYKIEVKGGIPKTTGTLSSAVQGYWREFGTRAGFRGRKRTVLAYAAAITRLSGGTGGEPAGLYATKALNRFRAMIRFYYGKAQWWRL